MPRPRKADRDEVLSDTRQQLLNAAVEEFAREGYVGANINRISQNAGFAKGTIYNYFTSKRNLMLALIDEIATAQINFIMQQVEPEQDPIGRLRGFFRAGFAFVSQHPAQAQVVISAVYGPDTEFMQRIYQAYDRLFMMIIEDILEVGIAHGDFQPVEPDHAVALIMSVYLGSCSQFDLGGGIWLDPDRMVDLILGGLCHVDRRNSGQ